MKNIILILTFSILLISCGGKENTSNIDDLIKSKNTKELQLKKSALQADITKIEAVLATMNVTQEEALVSVLTLKDTVFNHYIDIQGNVDTKQNILVQPEMPGSLVELRVKTGQRVSAGQVLGRVDDGGMGQQLAQVQTQYELAKTTFDRQKRLWDQKIGSEIQFLQAQTQMTSLQKSINQIKQQWNKTLIKAPFSGVIDEIFVEKGQIVSPSPQGLMRIVNLSNMYVSTSVPETYIGKLKVGTTVDALITSIGKTYKGKVRQVGSYINPSNRSFGIEVSVPNPDNLLRPNQVAKLKIVDYSNKSAIIIPSNVIMQDAEGKKYVFVADKGLAKKVVIKVGLSADNTTEVISGLVSGDKIVTEGANSISEGMKLNF